MPKIEHEDNNKVELRTFLFGPVLSHTTLNKSFIKELKSRGDNADLDFRDKLAGHIEKENEYSQDDRDWFINETADIFKTYVNKLTKHSLTEVAGRPSITGVNLHSLWINYMKKNEFNPIHDHAGDISFVIYLQVPSELKKENESFVGVGSGPGCICFYYGEKSLNYRSQYHFIPNEGDMFLFPASLRHMVSPFRSDVTRISVSGNLSFDHGKVFSAKHGNIT